MKNNHPIALASTFKYTWMAALCISVVACGGSSDGTSSSADSNSDAYAYSQNIEGADHGDSLTEQIEASTTLTNEEKQSLLDSLTLNSATDTSAVEVRALAENAVLDPNLSPMLAPEEKFFTIDEATQTTVTRDDIDTIYSGVNASDTNRWFTEPMYAELLLSTNERTFPVVTDGRGGHLVMAGRYGNGRTVFTRTNKFVTNIAAKKSATDLQLFENLLSWLTENNTAGYKASKLAGQKMKVLVLDGVTEFDRIDTLKITKTTGFDFIDPNTYPMIVVGESVKDSEVSVIDDYVAQGGAVFYARLTWYQKPRGEVATLYGDNFAAYPMTRWMRKAGYGLSSRVFRDAFVDGWPMLNFVSRDNVTAAYPPEAAEKYMKLIKGDNLEATLTGYVGKTDAEKFEAMGKIAGLLASTNPGNNALVQAWNTTDTVFSTALRKGKVDCDAASLAMACSFMRSYSELLTPAAHANVSAMTTKSAEIFPGKASGTKQTATVTVSSEKNGIGYNVPGTWVSTDRWINAGEELNISVPITETNVDLDVIVGAQSDYLSNTSPNSIKYLERLPKVSWRVKLKPGANKIVTPAGGLVFLTATKKYSNRTLDVQVIGGIPSLRFKLGETDPAVFLADSKNSTVPFFEMEGERIRIIMPSSVLATFVTSPAKLTSAWDDKRSASDTYLGLTDPAGSTSVNSPSAVKELIVMDQQISAGFLHANYPVMYPVAIAKSMVTIGVLGVGEGWGDPHEWGHNMQTNNIVTTNHPVVTMGPLYPYNFAPSRDITNNLLSLWDGYKNGQKTRLDQEPEGYPSAWKFIGTPGNDFNKLTFWDGLTFFHQYSMRYGWDFHGMVLKKYREHAYNVRPDATFADLNIKITPEKSPSKQDQIDAFALFTSRVSGFDQRANMKAWGLPITQAVSDRIASWAYPSDEQITWMRSDCSNMRKTNPTLKCIQPGDASLSPMVFERSVIKACTGWSKSLVYTKGAKVSYDGKNWSAKWWTKGELPGSSGSAWAVISGGC